MSKDTKPNLQDAATLTPDEAMARSIEIQRAIIAHAGSAVNDLLHDMVSRLTAWEFPESARLAVVRHRIEVDIQATLDLNLAVVDRAHDPDPEGPLAVPLPEDFDLDATEPYMVIAQKALHVAIRLIDLAHANTLDAIGHTPGTLVSPGALGAYGLILSSYAAGIVDGAVLYLTDRHGERWSSLVLIDVLDEMIEANERVPPTDGDREEMIQALADAWSGWHLAGPVQRKGGAWELGISATPEDNADRFRDYVEHGKAREDGSIVWECEAATFRELVENTIELAGARGFN